MRKATYDRDLGISCYWRNEFLMQVPGGFHMI